MPFTYQQIASYQLRHSVSVLIRNLMSVVEPPASFRIIETTQLTIEILNQIKPIVLFLQYLPNDRAMLLVEQYYEPLQTSFPKLIAQYELF